MNPSKLENISNWPYPKILKDLQRFLGCPNFYRQFIEDFSGIAGPLTTLTAKGVNVESGLELDGLKEAFKKLAAKFTSAPFLIHFSFSLPRFIHVDSSGYAYSGILSQKTSQGELRPVA